MTPAAIVLNYSVKDIRHDVRQIIYIYILGECRTLWGERERAVTKSYLSSYSGIGAGTGPAGPAMAGPFSAEVT